MVTVIRGVKRASQMCLPLSAVNKNDVALVGGKGASLGELLRAGVPVPQGYVVTTDAYREFMSENGLDLEVERVLKDINVNDASELSRAASQMQGSVLSSSLSPSIESMIRSAYHDLGCGPVAVRSSATIEDLPNASFAGQLDTYLNIPTNLDKEGRFLIPENLKSYSNISNEVTFIGQGHYFQIWEPQAATERQKKSRERLVREKRTLGSILTSSKNKND